MRTVTGAFVAGCSRSLQRLDPGVPIGPWGARNTQTAIGVHRPPTVTALAVGDVNALPAAVIIAIDTVTWPDGVASIVSSAVSDATGVPADAVIVGASHTHSSLPLDDMYLAPWDHDGSARQLRDDLLAEIPALAARAVAARRPVHAIASKVSCSVARSRRQQAFGRRVVGVAGIPTDQTLDVVDLVDNDGLSVATIVVFGCHPTTLAWGNLQVSPDYVAMLREIVERETGAPVVFLQGCGADRAPVFGFSNRVDDADAVGRALGHLACASLFESRQSVLEIEPVAVISSGAPLCITRSALPRMEDARVSASHHEIALPLRPLDVTRARHDAERAQERLSAGQAGASAQLQQALIARELAERFPSERGGRVQVNAIGIGSDLVILGWPGELSGAFDAAIQVAARPKHTITATNVNGYVGYLPTAEQFEEGGYEVDASPFAAAAPEIVVDELSRFARRLNTGRRGNPI
jgi:hypothetical protein